MTECPPACRELVAALEAEPSLQDGAAPQAGLPYIWLDVCTVNQVEQQQLPEDYFYTTFRQASSASGTQSWCCSRGAIPYMYP